MERAFIYGDSLLKATVPDEDMHYRFHLPEVMAQYPTDRLEVVNRAKMGATVTKGLSLVEHDVQRGMDARWALVAYGGNDSDFDWEAIAAAPEQEHLPHTVLPEFIEKLRCAVQELASAGVQPVLMTLPPIDGQRYFQFICRRADGGSILRWLGDVGRIYRHQELYSDAVAALAMTEGLPLIDVRRQFLPMRDLPRYIAADGIHLTMTGYRCLFDTLAGWIRERL
ncbi:MAG TPA: SGNH/GDSL hydrolase family protein [Oscillibacter sp.]|nr:SGNH/GDSL hydrolase family protein [Oscillibacter sp.]